MYAYRWRAPRKRPINFGPDFLQKKLPQTILATLERSSYKIRPTGPVLSYGNKQKNGVFNAHAQSHYYTR